MDPAVVRPPKHPRLLRLQRGVSITVALTRLRRHRDVVWAVPDFRAHIAGTFIPNDPAWAARRATGSSCSGTSSGRSA